MAFYYPKSQIQTNLFTEGGEYILEFNKREYVGYYYQISDGKKYVGNIPNSNSPLLLIPIEKTNFPQFTPNNPPITYKPNHDFGESYLSPNGMINNEDYRRLTEIGIDRFPPLPYFPQPTSKDYQIGEFQRYFTKKTNELIYIEVSKETFNKFINEDSTVALDLYNPISLPWNLTGDEKQVYQSNKNIVELVERENNWYGFTSYFQKDFSKYYLAS